MLDTQLQVFKCVVDKGSFSLAAQELYMTQSSISQQIHALECHYGVKLFDRLHRRIIITEAGRALYPYAVELERLYMNADKTLRGLMDVISGRLAIGASLTIGEYLLPEYLVQFSRLYPLVNISMTIENTEKIISKVMDGSLSLGFVEGLYEPVAALADIRFSGDQLVIVASPDFITGQHCVALTDLLRERWVLREPDSGTRRVFEQFVQRHGGSGIDLNIAMELSSTEAIKNAVKSGIGLGVMSYLTVINEIKRGELIILDLAEGAIERNFTMLCHRDTFQTLAIEKFSAFITKKGTC